MSERQKITVLVAEDDARTCEMIKGALDGSAYEVVGEAADGRRAVEMTIGLKPDVVLLELGLPVMGGLEAAREMSDKQATPIVVLTSDACPELVEEATLAGVGSFVVGPPAAGDLDRAISIARARFADLAEIRRLNDLLTRETKLRWSADYFRAIYEINPLGIALVDLASQRFLQANRAFQSLIGYSEDELRNLTVKDITHPEDWEREQGDISRRLRGETEEYELEKRYIRCDAEVRWVRVTGAIIEDPDGRQLALAAVVDLTERKRAEHELRGEREQLLSILGSIDEVTYITDPETYEILYVNPAFERILKKDVVGGICYKEFQGFDSPCTFCTNAIILEQNPAPHFWEYYNKKLDRYFSIVDRIIRWPDGRDVRFEMAIDITERKQMEDALTRSENTFRAAFHTSPDSININRLADGLYLDMNEGFMRIMGYAREDVLGKTSVDLNIWDDAGDRDRLLEGLRQDGIVENLEAKFRRKDGSLRDGLMSARVVDLGGEPCILSITRDITDIKRAEEEKDRLFAQLQQAMKMEAVGRLAGGVAHDFNNLLTSITGNIQLSLMDLRPGDPMRDVMDEIGKAAHSAASLTHQLLAFSRKQLIEPRILDMNELISSLHKMLTRLIGEDIALETIPGRLLGAVKVDPGQFEQILVNLAVNARDAMPDGGRLIIETSNIELTEEYHRLHPHSHPGAYVMLAVSDTGTGMSDDVKSHLFEPFFTTKPKGRGTGLGLATIYGTIKQAGGNVEVYSEEGEGTTFKIYLPMVSQKAERLQAPDHITEMPGGGETVLVVEDERSVREMVFRILKRLGYNVLQAPDGGQAFMLAEEYEDRIDLLLTDVIMPGMNGRQLADRLSKIHPETRVLYTSGYTENAIAHHGVIDEGLHFIGKPYTPQGLAKKLRRVLER